MARLFASASSEYLEHAAAAVTAVPATLMAWVKTGTTGIVIMAVGEGAGSSRLQMGITLSKLSAQTTNTAGTSAFASSVASIDTGQWVHAAALYASATSRNTVVNGVLGTPDTTNIVLGGTIDRTTIGARYHAGVRGSYFNGSIAEVAIFNTELPIDVIQAIAKRFASPLDFKSHGLVMYVPLWGYSSPERDLVV